MWLLGEVFDWFVVKTFRVEDVSACSTPLARDLITTVNMGTHE